MGWLLAGVIVIAPSSAAAQQGTPTPSARELWKAYPIQQGTATPTSTATAAGAESSGLRASAPAETGDDMENPYLLLFGAIGAILALALGSAALRRWGSREGADPTRAAPMMLATVIAMVPDERPRAPRLTALASVPPGKRDEPPEKPAGAVEPPDPEQSWTAEIEWQDAGKGPRFCLIARPAGGGNDALIAASEPLTWPPRDAADVRRMRNEVARVEAALLSSGWSPLPPGSAWYSKRFAWAAVAQPVTTGRFRRDVEWPEDTGELWRCEIKWKPGYVNSRFTVVATEPGRRRGRTVGASEPFKWLLMADPNPQSLEQRAQVSWLDEQILAAGWEPVARGWLWCALRYVWRGEGPPPEQLELAGGARHGGDDGEP